MIKLGVIGYGYWGPNLVRNFSATSGCQVVAVSDLNERRLDLVKSHYPAIAVTTDHETLFADPDIDAIAIATPVASHYNLALAALMAGKHVFVEKPLASSVAQCSRLVTEAEQRKLVLHVDHTFLYTGAVRKIRELVDQDQLGDIYYYDSVRVNLGLFQHDVDVIWDLAVHDLSIIDYLFPWKPVAVSATGVSHVPGKPANMAFVTVFFENNVIAHLHVNWLAPLKVRRTLIGGSRKMIVYDDIEPSEKIKVYDKGISLNGGKDSLYQSMIEYRSGDMWAPQLQTIEALRVEAEEFVHCITHGGTPISDGQAGLRIVRILEAASRSLTELGRPVNLDWLFGSGAGSNAGTRMQAASAASR
jgi:predicted dehydrogenase